MFTRCPSCRAAFSITQQQLEIAAGMVRCGMCEHVFDAKLFLFNESLDEEYGEQVEDYQEKELINQPSLDQVDIEFDSGEHSSVDLEVLDRELHDGSVTDSDQVTNIVDKASEPEQQTVKDNEENDLAEPAIPKIIADQVSSLEQEPAKFKPQQLFAILPVLALLGTLSLQAIAALKIELIPAQYKDQVCQWLTCTVNTPRALSQIEVLNRSIFTHPSESDALMVTLTIINRAEFSQPYPVIQLRFLNTSGNVIAARQFSANHYMRDKWVPETLMPSSSPLSIQLEIHDVGEEVVSYDFDFL